MVKDVKAIGSGVGVKKRLAYMKAILVLEQMLFMEFKNLFSFSRYLSLKFRKYKGLY